MYEQDVNVRERNNASRIVRPTYVCALSRTRTLALHSITRPILFETCCNRRTGGPAESRAWDGMTSADVDSRNKLGSCLPLSAALTPFVQSGPNGETKTGDLFRRFGPLYARLLDMQHHGRATGYHRPPSLACCAIYGKIPLRSPGPLAECVTRRRSTRTTTLEFSLVPRLPRLYCHAPIAAMEDSAVKIGTS